MKKVFVCAGMGLAKNDNINKQAIKLGELLAKSGCIYVQGGASVGLMGLTLREFIKTSKNVEFYIPEAYYKNDAPALIEVVGEANFNAIKTMGEADRLTKIKQCDEIIVLPGGTGTFEELLYCNETIRSNEHGTRIQLVNIDGYYDGLFTQINTGMEQGFIKPCGIKFQVVKNVDELSFNC